MSGIYFSNSIAVAAFGMILSAAFCDILWTWRKCLVMAGSMAVILLFQGFIYFRIGVDVVQYTYPMVTHFPLIIVLCVLSKKRLWPTISVLTAYLCCQTRRWLALLIVAIFSGGAAMQSVAELVMTLPLLLILLRFVAPSVRSISRHTFTAQWQFGLVPALYYGFDYLTSVYTNLLLDGVLVAVEFMPFVCSVAYLVFIVYYS
ncbi:MAG: histidine kinase, partial [Lachnospiraceae bacterium]|nr:histidine kinase [Lachnospiraceae bacterium]